MLEAARHHLQRPRPSIRQHPRTPPPPSETRTPPPDDPTSVARMAHFRRDYAVLGPEVVRRHNTKGEHVEARQREAAPPAEEHARQTHPQPPTSGHRPRAPAGNTATSKPAKQTPPEPDTAQLGHLDYSPSEGAACHPSAEAERTAARDRDLWIGRMTDNE